jgi:phosphoribosylformylglycinamidine synthase
VAGFKVTVNVSPLPGVLDPAAAAVMRALPALNFDGVSNAQIGKTINFDLEAASETEAREEVTKMCEALLANPVIEVYEIHIEPAHETVNA